MKTVFGDASLTEEAFNYIINRLPDGKTLLELGSGRVTELFLQHYKVYSVEHDLMWVDTTESNYIYAPLVDNAWYDADVLAESLPTEYDFLLVDGPPSPTRRANFIKHMHLFRSDVAWFFDDLQREQDAKTFETIREMTGRSAEVFQFGVKRCGVLESK
jgi:hypothetical protein